MVNPRRHRGIGTHGDAIQPLVPLAKTDWPDLKGRNMFIVKELAREKVFKLVAARFKIRFQQLFEGALGIRIRGHALKHLPINHIAKNLRRQLCGGARIDATAALSIFIPPPAPELVQRLQSVVRDKANTTTPKRYARAYFG